MNKRPLRAAGFVALFLMAADPTGGAQSPGLVNLGGCAGAPDGTQCNDSDACTTNDVCLGGSCVAGGTAAFTPAPGSPVPSGDYPNDVAVGDFNLDGESDLVVVNLNSGDLTILLGAGTGTFDQAAGSPIQVAPIGFPLRSVAVADFDLDLEADLAVLSQSYLSPHHRVTVLRGDGTGRFAEVAGSAVGVGSTPLDLVTGDLNRDGKPDVAVANYNSANVTILLGDGTGHLVQAPGSPVSAGTGPSSIAVTDFNLDLNPDLAVTNLSLGTVTILLGDGTGGFTQPASSPHGVGSYPYSAAAWDFNRDGKPDLAVANSGSRDVTILLGNGLGGFVQASGSPIAMLGYRPESIAAGDFDLDGDADLVVTSPAKVLLGDGAGGFTLGPAAPVLSGHQIATGDFNLDRRLDLALANGSHAGVTILLGTPSLLDCDDALACTVDDCEPATGCTHAQLPAGSTCDDGDVCSVQDRCDASGACGGVPDDCNDEDACTVDHCDPGTGCTHTPDFEAPCDDGDPCTANDACDLYGVCIGAPVCDDADPCTVDTCGAAGECLHTPVSCDDQNACTVDSCDPVTGDCTFAPLSCGDDGDPCTREFCASPQGCSHAPACDDFSQCTTDSCNPTTGACTYIPNLCDDGNPCTTDFCVGDGFCVHPQINCSDQNSCTVDFCDPATGNCGHTTLQCDDGNPCTTDSCTGTACRNVQVNCLDQNPCTLDSCDPVTGDCIHSAPQCDDGDPCTTDGCTGAGCKHEPTNCNDQNSCTVDVCDATGGCQNDPVSCDDGVACTNDVCDPTTGACGHIQTDCACAGADTDGDGVPDACDCSPADPLNLLPGNVPGLRFQDKSTIVWNAQPQSDHFDVVRGTRAELPVGPGGDETCFAEVMPPLSDPTRPGLAGVLWYVVRGKNACGEGTYGNQHRNPGPAMNGPARVTSSCP